MERFSEEHSKHLLGKEWLAKTDNQTSTPYLFKFFSSTVDLSCCILLTDTKSVWAEVLNSKQFARRWRDGQSTSAPPLLEGEEEETWREKTLKLLSKAHTIGGIEDASFEIVQSNYSDLAVELEWASFKWRWETCFVGHKMSAEVISKHLVFPFISLSHLALSSPEALSAMSDADVEKAVDKLGRTARRAVDTHVKNAVAKPRLASTLRRMTAMFNFISDLPPVISSAEGPDLHIELPESKLAAPHSHTTNNTLRSISPQLRNRNEFTRATSVEPTGPSKPQSDADSATEPDDEDEAVLDQKSRSSAGPSRGSPMPESPKLPATSVPSDSESSPVRPPKKQRMKPVESSSADEDSEAERRRRVAQLKTGSAASGVKRGGTKQPIKRGGKRF